MEKLNCKKWITIVALLVCFFLPDLMKNGLAQVDHTGIIWVVPNRPDAYPVNGNRTGNSALNLAFEDYHVMEYKFLDSLYVNYLIGNLPIYQIKLQEDYAQLELDLIYLLDDCFPGFFMEYVYPYQYPFIVGGETLSTNNGFISLEFVDSIFDHSLVPRTNTRSYNKKMDMILRKYDIKSYTYDPYVSHITGDTIERTIEILCQYQDLVPLYNDLLTFSNKYDYMFIHGNVLFFDSSPPCGAYSGMSIENNSIRIFPNPALDEITVSGVIVDNISMYDVMGKLVVTKFDPVTNKINLKHLPDGIYFLKIISHDGLQCIDKIIKN